MELYIKDHLKQKSLSDLVCLRMRKNQIKEQKRRKPTCFVYTNIKDKAKIKQFVKCDYGCGKKRVYFVRWELYLINHVPLDFSSCMLTSIAIYGSEKSWHQS